MNIADLRNAYKDAQHRTPQDVMTPCLVGTGKGHMEFRKATVMTASHYPDDAALLAVARLVKIETIAAFANAETRWLGERAMKRIDEILGLS